MDLGFQDFSVRILIVQQRQYQTINWSVKIYHVAIQQSMEYVHSNVFAAAQHQRQSLHVVLYRVLMDLPLTRQLVFASVVKVFRELFVKTMIAQQHQ